MAKKKMKTTKTRAGRPKQDFASWVQNTSDKSSGGVSCRTCNHPGAQTLRDLLNAMIEHGIKHITRQQLFKKLREEHDDFPVMFQAFKNHLYNHERALWEKAKGYDTRG